MDSELGRNRPGRQQVRDDRRLRERTRVLSRRSVSALAGAALAVACLGAIASGCGSTTTAADTTNPPPMNWTRGQTVVSIEFDDGSAEQYGARSILASHKMKATFFINSGTLINSYHMTWAQVHQLYAEGNEIAGHTVLHQHLTALSAAEARREVCDDRSSLLRQGFAVADFAYPYGDYNTTVQSIPQECGYNSARWILGVYSPSCQRASCPFAESIPPVDPYLTRSPQNVLATDSLANIEGYVTQAQQHGGGWVQIVFHHICNQCDTYAVTEPVFREFIGWLAAQKNTTTATIRQVIGGPLQPAVAGPDPVNLPGSNLLHNPSLEQASVGESATGQRLLTPTGWEATSFGSNTVQWTRTTEAHSGGYAERLDVTSLTSGAARLLSKMDLGEYAPTPTVGHDYYVSAYYKSTAPVLFYIYTRDQLGEWNWWGNSHLLPRSSTWTKGAFTTQPIPAGTTGISVGLGIEQKGTLTMDDFSLSLRE
jgi:peptidoglycan/xylan/chitin deacetylase (PgdA/CDA1 family)